MLEYSDDVVASTADALSKLVLIAGFCIRACVCSSTSYLHCLSHLQGIQPSGVFAQREQKSNAASYRVHDREDLLETVRRLRQEVPFPIQCDRIHYAFPNSFIVCNKHLTPRSIALPSLCADLELSRYCSYARVDFNRLTRWT